GSRYLDSIVVHKADDTCDLLIFDPMPGGSGLLDQMLERWDELITATRALLSDCPQDCGQACYMCLLTFQNQFNHSRIDRHRAAELILGLQHKPDFYRVIAELHEEATASDTGKPTNVGEARFVRLLRDHHFPEGQCNADITTTAGLKTRPDWLHEQTKVAVYQDGMSKALHGDPKRAQKDQLIRQMLELDGYKVIVVQSRDLNDPQIVRAHLRNIADAISRLDLAEMIETAPLEFEIAETAAGSDDSDEPQPTPPGALNTLSSDLIEFADPRCHSFLKEWASKGHPIPEIGFELADEDGIVEASAELAWPPKKIAAVFAEEEGREFFERDDWTIYDAATLQEHSDEIIAKLGGAE
ncbi:MAG: DUF1998 domain-containing protein, partial [Planctomycetales bacterium]|nr:DUF1998 domain-containing protein [Planctomycetales bacterium]